MEGQERCECPPPYLRTIPGMLKIVEMVFTLLTFSISFGIGWSRYGGGWVEFTGMSCFITITIWFIFHMINLTRRICFNFLYELIVYCIMTVILFISGIVAAARSQQIYDYRASLGTCSFFAFASAIVCGADAVLQYQGYQRGNYHSSSATTTAETTTTTQSTVVATY